MWCFSFLFNLMCFLLPSKLYWNWSWDLMKLTLRLKKYLSVTSYFNFCYSFKGCIWFSLLFSSSCSILLYLSYSSNLTCFILFDYMVIENEILVKRELRCKRYLCVCFFLSFIVFLLKSLCACLCSFLLMGESTLWWTKIGNWESIQESKSSVF